MNMYIYLILGCAIVEGRYGMKGGGQEGRGIQFLRQVYMYEGWRERFVLKNAISALLNGHIPLPSVCSAFTEVPLDKFLNSSSSIVLSSENIDPSWRDETVRM